MVAGNLTNFKVALSGAPASGQSWTFRIRKNGTDPASNSCTIGAAATSCTISGPISFANGDRLAIFADRTSGSITSTRVSFKADFAFSP
jgi:hypothetical protein